MTRSDSLKLKNLCEHIIACADLWAQSGVSRVNAIINAANEIRARIDDISEKSQC